MSNAAYTDAYKKRWDDCQPLFITDNIAERKEVHLSDRYLLHICEYGGKVGDWNLYGSECSLVDCNSEAISKWHSIDNNGDFYKIIKHSDGKEYLIFRQDLYGYSVLDIESREKMQFFPEKSLNSGADNETFIWTDIEYNPISNVLAVTGCYWACPYNVHLFTFDNPMSENQKFIDLRECFEPIECGYSIYCDVDFVKWENDILHIKSLNTETKIIETVEIEQSKYFKWLNEKGQEL